MYACRFLAPFLLCLVGPGLPAVASAQDAKASQVAIDPRQFCATKADAVQRTIRFDVSALRVGKLGIASAPLNTLDALGEVQLAMLSLNCRLLVAGKITADQFLAKQSEILEFALDVQSLRELAQTRAGKPVTKKPARLSVADLAKSLGLQLRGAGAIGQSGGADLVEETADHIIARYSPIATRTS